MNFKVAIKCSNCRSDFEISSNFINDKATLECPSCNAQFPKEHWENLKSGLIGLGSVPHKILDEQSGNTIFQTSLQTTFENFCHSKK